MTLLEEVPTETRPRARIPVLETGAADAARAASRGRKSNCAARQRSPHCREHRAHSASLSRRGRQTIHRRGEPAGRRGGFVISLDARLIGVCGVDPREGGLRSATGSARPIGARATPPRPCAR